MEELFRVGVISNTHGIRGEVKVYPTTDNVRRFDDLKEVILDTGKEQLNLHVTSVKYFKNMVILKFKEFDNINDIIPYKGMDLLVTRENAIPLEEGEYYIADIIGSKVITDEDKILGTLTNAKLAELAKEMGIDTAKLKTKAQLIAAITDVPLEDAIAEDDDGVDDGEAPPVLTPEAPVV